MNTRKAVAVLVALTLPLGAVLSAQIRTGKTVYPTAQTGPERPRSLRATPPEAQLDRFPIEPGVLTAGEIVRLGLRVAKLDTAWTGYNWYRNVRDGRFVLETILPGVEVLVDSTGTPRYRRDCGNRLVGLAKCPNCAKSALFGNGLVPKLEEVRNPTPIPLKPLSQPSPLRRVADGLRDIATGLWNGLGNLGLSLLWLALILLALLLLPLIIYLLYRWWKGRARSAPGGNTSRSVGSQTPTPSLEVASGGGVKLPPNVTPPVTTGTSGVGESSEREPSGPAVATASAAASVPTARAITKRFISFEPADDRQPHMIRFSGYRGVSYDEQNGVTTLRFHNNG